MPLLTVLHADVSSIRVEVTEREKTDEYIIEMLKAKNSDVSDMLTRGERVQVVFFRRYGKSKNIASIGLRVTKGLCDYLLEKGFVFMGHSYSKVERRFHVKQCYNCQAFGHISSACKESTPTCFRCSGAHDSAECVNKGSEHWHCINCKRSPNPHIQAGAASHNAGSADCPVRRRQLGFSKN